MADDQPIIIIRKKVHGGGHHGGAWKVAYADFVTAMMALFIVLWLLSSTSKKEQEEIGGYFRDPKGVASKHGTDKADIKADVPKKQDMAKLKLVMLHAIEQVDLLNKLKKQIEITVTEEGLRIELMESDQGTFFEMGSAKPTPVLVELLKVLSGQVGLLPNTISVEGHTDSHPYSTVSTYGNWELSADRANVARRLMQANGVRSEQVSQVRGFADQRLRMPDNPFDASNRRISLIVQYLPDRTKDGTIKDVADANNAKSTVGNPPSAEQPATMVSTPVKQDHPAKSADPIASAVTPVAAPPKGLAGLLTRVHIRH